LSLRAAGVDVGGSGESSKKTYRAIDLQNLLNTNPDRYTAMQDEIMRAYSEGRVLR
jgi:hypothetical protein